MKCKHALNNSTASGSRFWFSGGHFNLVAAGGPLSLRLSVVGSQPYRGLGLLLGVRVFPKLLNSAVAARHTLDNQLQSHKMKKERRKIRF